MADAEGRGDVGAFAVVRNHRVCSLLDFQMVIAAVAVGVGVGVGERRVRRCAEVASVAIGNQFAVDALWER